MKVNYCGSWGSFKNCFTLISNNIRKIYPLSNVVGKVISGSTKKFNINLVDNNGKEIEVLGKKINKS